MAQGPIIIVVLSVILFMNLQLYFKKLGYFITSSVVKTKQTARKQSFLQHNYKLGDLIPTLSVLVV